MCIKESNRIGMEDNVLLQQLACARLKVIVVRSVVAN